MSAMVSMEPVRILGFCATAQEGRQWATAGLWTFGEGQAMTPPSLASAGPPPTPPPVAPLDEILTELEGSRADR